MTQDTQATVAQVVQALDAVLSSEVGRQIFLKLASGQGTQTEDGRAWLHARLVLAEHQSIDRDDPAASTPPMPHGQVPCDTALAVGNLIFALERWKATTTRGARRPWERLVAACADLVAAQHAEQVSVGDGCVQVNMNQAEREAVEAMQAAAQALTKARELAERADYGTQITQSLAAAQKELRFALDTAHDRN